MKKYIKYIILIIFISLFIGIVHVSAIPVIDISLDNTSISVADTEVITSATVDLSAVDNDEINNDTNLENSNNNIDNLNDFNKMHIIGIVCASAIVLGIIIFFVIKKR